MEYLAIILVLGLLSLVVAFVFYRRVTSVSIETGAASAAEVARLTEISDAIAEGAMAFLKREYSILAIFMAIFAVIIAFAISDPHASAPMGLLSAVSFVIGAGISVAAGYIGMNIATKGNVRTAAAARISLQESFKIAFKPGAILFLIRYICKRKNELTLNK